MTTAVVHTSSPEGRAAIVHAAREAVARREELLVLQVLEDEPDSDVASDLIALRAEIQAILENDSNREVPWDLRTAQHSGDPVGSLVELVADSDAGLLVVGTRRMSSVGKFLLERSLQRLLLEVEVPVLVVKDELPRRAHR